MLDNEIKIIEEMYLKNGLTYEEIEDCFENGYFEKNKQKFIDNQGVNTYDIERWIELENTLGCELDINQAIEIMSNLWESYNLDTFDLIHKLTT